jgi:hypothetical protein
VPDVLLILTTVLLTLLVERGYTVPRDIRRNDERIVNRDEDLRAWIVENRKLVRRDFLRIWAAEARKKDGPDYSVSQCQKVKNEVLQRYQDELRDSEREVRDVWLSEQLPHRLWRHITRRSIPDLMAPTERAHTIAEWETSAEDSMKAGEELRAAVEQRRADAGKPPLRSLRLAEIV